MFDNIKSDTQFSLGIGLGFMRGLIPYYSNAVKNRCSVICNQTKFD